MSRCSRHRPFDGPDEIGLPERLLQRRMGIDSLCGSSRHEDMRDEARERYGRDRRDAAPERQMYVHDHQVRPQPNGGCHGALLAGARLADRMAQIRQNLGKQVADDGVVPRRRGYKATSRIVHYDGALPELLRFV